MFTSLRAEMWPQPADAALTLAKMHLAQANMRSGIRSMPVLGILCGLIYLRWFSVEAVTAWYGVFMLAWAFRVTAEKWLPADSSDLASVRRAAKAYLAHSTLFICAWASQGFLFWVPGDEMNHLAIAVILLASSMSASLTAAWWPAPLAQVSLYIGSLGVLFLAEGTETSLLLAFLSVVFIRFVLASTSNLHDAAQRMLSLETEKDVLIAGLMASDRAKNEFLANMSHELRTPLNAILGFSELIHTELLGPVGVARYRDYAGDIHASGSHLLSLINDILDHAKIESGHFIPHDEEVEVEAIGNDALRFFRLKAQEAGVTLQPELAPNLMLSADKRALKQAIANLVSNALKFTPPGGTVTLGARRTAFGATTIWVSDTGCGISPADQKKIFKSFGQGRHDVALKEKGTGLGLSIVKGIVEAHGGTIGLNSAAGRGATFTITLPAARTVRALPKAA